MNSLLHGFADALSLINLSYCLIGCFLGTVVGILPGLGPAATMAMLLPLTSYLPPAGMIIMMSGIYYGAQYGGSTTSILVNIPGEASSVVTTIDGFQMTKQGRAGQALAIAALASFIAGTAGVLLLSIIGPVLAEFGLRFGPPEYFCLVLFSLTMVLSFSSGQILKGIIAMVVGIMFTCVGLDPLSGKRRFVFGIAELTGGLDVIPVIMGLFGIAEVLASAEEGIKSVFSGKLKALIPQGQELKRGLLASLRGTVVGCALGLLPGIGPTAGTFISYDIEKRISKNPSKFGTGCIEGVAAPEAANNATAQVGFIPLMTLGIPTVPIMAILIAAFMLYGLTPGPTLFTQHGRLTWNIIASMYIGNVMLVVLNLPLVGLWARLCLVPYRILGPLILGICFVGGYSMRNSMFDVWSMIFFGMMGYVMKRRNWPIPPLVLGFILGPMFEQNLRASLGFSGGSILIFVTRPISATFVGLTILSLILSWKLLRKGTSASKESIV